MVSCLISCVLIVSLDESLLQLTANKEVILSAGALNTPQILLHSGIGDEIELQNVGITPLHFLPSVGKNMTDHPYVTVVWTVNSTVPPYVICLLGRSSWHFCCRMNATVALEEWRHNHTGPYSMSPTASNHVAFLRLPNDSSNFQTTMDPAAGPNTPHMELTPLVRNVITLL